MVDGETPRISRVAVDAAQKLSKKNATSGKRLFGGILGTTRAPCRDRSRKLKNEMSVCVCD